MIQYFQALGLWGMALAVAIAVIVTVAVVYVILRIFVDDEKASAFASYVLYGVAGLILGALAGLIVGIITGIACNSFDLGFYATVAAGLIVGCIVAHRSNN